VNRSQDAALLLARLLIAALSKFAASLATKGVPYSKLVAMLNVVVEVVGPTRLSLACGRC
jgi:hypothetical protein